MVSRNSDLNANTKQECSVLERKSVVEDLVADKKLQTRKSDVDHWLTVVFLPCGVDATALKRCIVQSTESLALNFLRHCLKVLYSVLCGCFC